MCTVHFVENKFLFLFLFLIQIHNPDIDLHMLLILQQFWLFHTVKHIRFEL
jgi:hypothetical protein